jgi:Aspartyl protease
VVPEKVVEVAPQAHALIDIRRGPYTCVYLEQSKISGAVAVGANHSDSLQNEPHMPQKVMFDTGANLVLIDETCARAAGLKIEPLRGPVASSMGGEGYTVGVARAVPVVVAKGTAWEVTVRVDMHVARGVHELYDLLLGTPFIYQIGAFADTVRQRMYYRPMLPKILNEQTAGQINFIPLKRNPAFVGATAVASSRWVGTQAVLGSSYAISEASSFDELFESGDVWSQQ